MRIGFGKVARTRYQMRRVRPILRILGRHGFGFFVDQLSGHPATRGAPDSAGDSLTTAQRLRRVLEELGPTFVKFGQMLTTRADLVPERFMVELRRLTEHVPPFDSKLARQIVERDLGRPISEIFSEFTDVPAASGTIGQVHYARLANGQAVVVKIKRPGIEKTFMGDLDLLDFLAGFMDRIEDLKVLRLPIMVQEFRRSVLREVDFVTEASFTTKMGEALSDQPSVRVPAVHWDLTTSSVLVLERLDGASFNDAQRMAGLPMERRREIAADLTGVFLHQFFKHGLFHADPHAGNIMLLDDGRIGLVDFGMCGRLGTDLRAHLATTLIALVRRDLDLITEVYLEIGALGEGTDIERLQSDLQEMLDKYYGIPMGQLDLQKVFSAAMRIAQTHHVVMPRDFVLLGKSFVTVVTLARQVDPQFDISQVIRPYTISLLAGKLSPRQLGSDAFRELWHMRQAMRQLPRDARSIVRRLLGGSLQFTLRLSQFDALSQEIDRATNRLAFSVMLGAIVIGSSVLLHAKVPPFLNAVLPGRLGEAVATAMPNISLLGLAGFLFAGILGALLALAIWRHGRL